MSVESAAYKPPELAFFCLERGEQEFGAPYTRDYVWMTDSAGRSAVIGSA